jgi:cation:H+ antiporter
MIGSLLSILAGVGLLYGGAEGLVRGSASVARRLGLTPLVIGLTVVAFGTSMPELVVSINAGLTGRAPVAVGNVVGSNIANIALILGTSALIRSVAVHAQVIRLDVPLLVGASLVMVWFLSDDYLGRGEGSLLLAGLIAYTVFSLRKARKETPDVQTEFAEGIPATTGSALLDAGMILVGLALLVGGAHLLVNGATDVARAFHISEAVIGLTVVAVGTSLPELATSIVAALKGEGDIALGNVIGSNLFNTLGILGTASLVTPLHPTGMSLVDLGVMLGLTLALLPLMYTGMSVSRTEGGLLLAAYTAYTLYLFP